MGPASFFAFAWKTKLTYIYIYIYVSVDHKHKYLIVIIKYRKLFADPYLAFLEKILFNQKRRHPTGRSHYDVSKHIVLNTTSCPLCFKQFADSWKCQRHYTTVHLKIISLYLSPLRQKVRTKQRPIATHAALPLQGLYEIVTHTHTHTRVKYMLVICIHIYVHIYVYILGVLWVCERHKNCLCFLYAVF